MVLLETIFFWRQYSSGVSWDACTTQANSGYCNYCVKPTKTSTTYQCWTKKDRNRNVSYSCSTGTLNNSDHKCYLYNQTSCESGWTAS